MTDEALQQLWMTYQDAWSQEDTAKRTQLLRASVSEDVVFTSPDNDDQGLDRISDVITGFQSRFPGAYFRGTRLFQQHGELLSAWTMFSRDHAPLINGYSHARFDEQQGRLTHLAGFWKL